MAALNSEFYFRFRAQTINLHSVAKCCAGLWPLFHIDLSPFVSVELNPIEMMCVFVQWMNFAYLIMFAMKILLKILIVCHLNEFKNIAFPVQWIALQPKRSSLRIPTERPLDYFRLRFAPRLVRCAVHPSIQSKRFLSHFFGFGHAHTSVCWLPLARLRWWCVIRYWKVKMHSDSQLNIF